MTPHQPGPGAPRPRRLPLLLGAAAALLIGAATPAAAGGAVIPAAAGGAVIPAATGAGAMAADASDVRATVAAAAAPQMQMVWTSNLSSPFLAGSLSFGTTDQLVLVGDWDGDGKDGFAVRSGNRYYFRNSLSSGPSQASTTFGTATDKALVGDWNGDGKDTLAVRRGATFLFRDGLTSGALRSFSWGRSTDGVLAGDWNGNGTDTFGLRRGNVYYFLNQFVNRAPDFTVRVGSSSDQPLVGDWNGDRKSTLALRSGNTYRFYNSLQALDAPAVRTWAQPNDRIFVGSFDGSRIDKLGAARGYDARYRIWELANQQRTARGLRPLQFSACLRDRYSQPVTASNSRAGELQHQTLARGLCSPDAYGENIAAGQTSPEEVMTAWMNSTGHRDNILARQWTVMGVGYTRTSTTYEYWWSQNFG